VGSAGSAGLLDFADVSTSTGALGTGAVGSLASRLSAVDETADDDRTGGVAGGMSVEGAGTGVGGNPEKPAALNCGTDIVGCMGMAGCWFGMGIVG